MFRPLQWPFRPAAPRHRPCRICAAPAALVDARETGGAADPSRRCLGCGFVFSEAAGATGARMVAPDEAAWGATLAEDCAGRLHRCKALRVHVDGVDQDAFAAGLRAGGFSSVTAGAAPVPPGGYDIVACFAPLARHPTPRALFAGLVEMLGASGLIVGSPLAFQGHLPATSEEALVRLGSTFGLVFHRGPRLFAFGHGRLRPELRDAVPAFGPPLTVTRLFAPADAAPAPTDWPDLMGRADEPSWLPPGRDGSFLCRWTATDRLSWFVRWDMAGDLQFRLAFRAEARPGFAAGSRLLLDGVAGHMTLDRGDIVAEFTMPGSGSGLLELHTPPVSSAGGLRVPTGYSDAGQS